MAKFKWYDNEVIRGLKRKGQPAFTVEYKRHSLQGVVNATLIKRTVKLWGRVVWRSNWIQFPNNQVVKLGSLLDVSQANKLLQKL